MRNGMGWLRIDVDMFLFLPQRLPQYLLLESSQLPFRCTRMSLKTHMAERSPLLPLHPPHNSYILTFCYPFTLVSSSACWKPSAPTFRKRQSRHKGSSGLSASAVENCLSFLLYNAFRCRNGRCGWCTGRNDRSIRVETSGLLAKVLTSTGWLRSVWNSKSKFWTQGKYPDQKQVSSSLPQTSMPMKNCQGPKTRRE